MTFWDFMVGGDADLGIWGTSGTIAVIVVAFVIAIGALAVLAIFNKKDFYDTQSIAFAAVAIALSFALSYVRLWKMPQGGSITLASLLPIAIYAYIFGPVKGLMAGIIHATLQLLQDAWILNFMQILLDYFIPFGIIAIVGVVPKFTKRFKCSKNKVIKNIIRFDLSIGMIIYAVIRFFSHTLSGVIFFSTYAGSQNPWLYSLGYNSFVFVDIAIAIIPAVILQFTRQFDMLCKMANNGRGINVKKRQSVDKYAFETQNKECQQSTNNSLQNTNKNE